MSGRYYRPSLTPTPGLGSYARTSAALLCGNPRVKIASNSRIYNWYDKRDQGQAYKERLLLSLGPIPVYKYKTRSLFALGV
jgi:hypothetical protein